LGLGKGGKRVGGHKRDTLVRKKNGLILRGKHGGGGVTASTEKAETKKGRDVLPPEGPPRVPGRRFWEGLVVRGGGTKPPERSFG